VTTRATRFLGRVAQFCSASRSASSKLTAVLVFTFTGRGGDAQDWFVAIWGMVMSASCAVLALACTAAPGARRVASRCSASGALQSREGLRLSRDGGARLRRDRRRRPSWRSASITAPVLPRESRRARRRSDRRGWATWDALGGDAPMRSTGVRRGRNDVSALTMGDELRGHPVAPRVASSSDPSVAPRRTAAARASLPADGDRWRRALRERRDTQRSEEAYVHDPRYILSKTRDNIHIGARARGGSRGFLSAPRWRHASPSRTQNQALSA
jgi:hypothetical protein